MRIRGSQEPTLKLVGDGTRESGGVSSIFGPLKVGLITTQITPSPAPTGSLNAWERSPRTHASRSSKAYAMSSIDTTRPVELGLIGSSVTTTREEEADA